MITVSRLEKTQADIWTHLNVTTSASWLLLAKRHIKASKIRVVAATTSNTALRSL